MSVECRTRLVYGYTISQRDLIPDAEEVITVDNMDFYQDEVCYIDSTRDDMVLWIAVLTTDPWCYPQDITDLDDIIHGEKGVRQEWLDAIWKAFIKHGAKRPEPRCYMISRYE